MEDDVATIEEDVYEAQAEDFADEPETSQVDELLEQWETQWQEEDQPDEKKNQEFQFSSLAEVVQSLDTVQGWEKIAASNGGDVLKRSTGEWVYKDETGKETSITAGVQGEASQRHAEILQGLWTQGSWISEYQKPDSDLLVCEVYFADGKGNISYEVYNFKPEPEVILPDSKNLEFLGDDYDDVDLLPSENIATDESASSLTAQSVSENQETAKAEAVISEINPQADGIELQDMDDGDLGSDVIVKASIQAEVLITPDENLLPLENFLILDQAVNLMAAVETDDGYDEETPRAEIRQLDANLKTAEALPIDPQLSLLARFSEMQAREIYPAQQEQTEPNPFLQREISDTAASLEGITIFEDSLDLDDDFETVISRAEADILGLEDRTVIEAVKPPLIDIATEVRAEINGIDLLYITDEGEDLEEASMPAVIAEAILDSTPQPQKQAVEPMETAGIALLDEIEIEIIEWARGAGELNPEIVIADEIVTLAASSEAILPAEEIVKSQVLETKASGITIEEILETPQTVEADLVVTQAVEDEPSETALKWQPEVEVKQEASEIISISETVLDIEPAVVKIATPMPIESNTPTVKAESQKQNTPESTIIKSSLETNGIALVETRDSKTDESLETGHEPAIVSKINSNEPAITASVVSRLNIGPAEVIKEISSGIEIETVQPNKPIENITDARAIPAYQSRPHQTIKSIKQPTQAEQPKIQLTVSKPEIRKATQDATEILDRVLEVKQEVKEPARPVIKLLERKPAKNRVIEKAATTQPHTELKSSTMRVDTKSTPITRVEQIIDSGILRVDTQKLNQRIYQAFSSQPASKPIIVKSTKKASPSFRPAELINKILTFKPAVVAGDDEAVRNTTEAYIPEFELAA